MRHITHPITDSTGSRGPDRGGTSSRHAADRTRLFRAAIRTTGLLFGDVDLDLPLDDAARGERARGGAAHGGR